MSDDRITNVRITVTTKDGSIIESDHVVETRDELRRALTRMSAEIETELDDRGLIPTDEPDDDAPRRTVHTLGEHERNGLWQCVDPPTWRTFYAWQNRNPVLHEGDDSPAWHYSPADHAEHSYWSMARSGTEDTTAATVAPLGDITSVTFVEVARLRADGSLTYFGSDGKRWQLSAGPGVNGWGRTDGS